FYCLNYRRESDLPDAQILYDSVLQPILGIKDLRNDSRIDYHKGNEPLTHLMEVVDSGEFEIAFTLFPAAFTEIKALADAGKIMPPKSTYIEPKIRSGLIIHELDR